MLILALNVLAANYSLSLPPFLYGQKVSYTFFVPKSVVSILLLREHTRPPPCFSRFDGGFHLAGALADATLPRVDAVGLATAYGAKADLLLDVRWVESARARSYY